MNNTTRVAITISADKDINTVFETLKGIGVTDASLEGNTVFGTVANNMINPLNTVDGVTQVIGEKEMREGKGNPMPTPAPRPPMPPVPSVVSVPRE